MNKKLWFHVKKPRFGDIGFRWVPVTIEGWIVFILGYGAIGSYPLFSYLRYFDYDPNTFIEVIAVVSITMVGACLMKGERPVWYWGDHWRK